MTVNCCVPNCSTNTKKNRGVKFHSFPKDQKKKREWIVAIRTGKAVSKHMKVCSLHFNDDDYVVTSMGKWRILKKDAIPSQNIPKRLFEKPKMTRRTLGRNNCSSLSTSSSPACSNSSYSDFTIVTDACNTLPPFNNPQCLTIEEPNESSEVAIEIEIQSERGVKQKTNEDKIPKMYSITTQTDITMTRNKLLSTQWLNDNTFSHYSGLTRNQFFVLYNLICRDEYFNVVFKNSLSQEDQLLLILFKYRHNLPNITISAHFNVNIKTVRGIIKLWTGRIYNKIRSIDFFNMAKKKGKEYNIVIDCTEIPIERSGNPLIQQVTFSNYKNRNTFKVLVGVSESGVAMYCSELYGGSISDREIVIASGFLNHLTEGMYVLADRGFDISDLLEEKKVHLNIPPFKHGNCMTEENVMKTKRIANRRIIVERVIGLTKTFRIISQPLPTNLWPLVSEVFYNCFMLVNFKEEIC